MHPAQLGGRVDAELLGERVPAPLVGGQRVGLPARRVQGPDQADGHGLAQRVLLGELLQQHHVLTRPAGPGVRVGQRLRGEHAQLLPLGGERREEVDLAHRAERAGSAPPAEGGAEDGGGRAVRAARERLAAPGHVVDELVGVDGDRVAVDHVPPGPPGDGVRAEHTSQPRDVRVHGRDRRLGGPLAPDVVDDLLGRDRLVAAGEDPREHRLLARAAEGDLAAVHGGREVAEHVQHDAWNRGSCAAHDCCRSFVPREQALPHR